MYLLKFNSRDTVELRVFSSVNAIYRHYPLKSLGNCRQTVANMGGVKEGQPFRNHKITIFKVPKVR